MFVFSTTLLCLYVFGFCWVLIIKIRNTEQITIWKAMAKSPASIALIVYTFIAVWFVGGLSVFHLYLMSTNQVKLMFTCCVAWWMYYVSCLSTVLFVDDIWELQVSLWSTSQPVQQRSCRKHQRDLLHAHPCIEEQLPLQGASGARSEASRNKWFHESKHGQKHWWHWDG